MAIAAPPLTALPPGSSQAPLLQTLEWVRNPLGMLEECRREYGDSFTLRLAGMPPMVMLADPEAVREVFTGDPEVLRSGEANALLSAALGPGSLLVIDGAEHLRERKLMLPPFHGERMRRYGDLIAGVTERRTVDWPVDKPFAVEPTMRAIALEVIMRAVFGVEDPERLSRLEAALGRLLGSITKPYRVLALLLLEPGGPTVAAWRRHAPTMRAVDALLLEEIRRRRKDPETAEREDILSLLLLVRDEDGRPMRDEHLRDELMTLLVAGHETTAAALAWAFERLARHPASFDRLRAEATENGDEYADAVAKETLRARTVIAFAIRHLARPFRVGDRELPAGVRVAPCAHLVHRNPDLYPEPEAFRPERFLDRPATTYGWIPFGGGTRRCLGGAFAVFEMKTVLRVVARAGLIRPAELEDEEVARRGLALVPAKGGRILWLPAPVG
jgi:cytochrome P450 family 135